ncbi:hypothetical protein RIF29_08143 [Crotalaria pallida]|uniref:Uncharacterized protein n=1 Tax=Crotalaria pallida TaxID=3830 RepID=A0AAN9J4Z5_CROPI
MTKTLAEQHEKPSSEEDDQKDRTLVRKPDSTVVNSSDMVVDLTKVDDGQRFDLAGGVINKKPENIGAENHEDYVTNNGNTDYVPWMVVQRAPRRKPVVRKEGVNPEFVGSDSNLFNPCKKMLMMIRSMIHDYFEAFYAHEDPAPGSLHTTSSYPITLHYILVIIHTTTLFNFNYTVLCLSLSLSLSLIRKFYFFIFIFGFKIFHFNLQSLLLLLLLLLLPFPTFCTHIFFYALQSHPFIFLCHY